MFSLEYQTTPTGTLEVGFYRMYRIFISFQMMINNTLTFEFIINVFFLFSTMFFILIYYISTHQIFICTSVVLHRWTKSKVKVKVMIKQLFRKFPSVTPVCQNIASFSSSSEIRMHSLRPDAQDLRNMPSNSFLMFPLPHVWKNDNLKGPFRSDQTDWTSR